MLSTASQSRRPTVLYARALTNARNTTFNEPACQAHPPAALNAHAHTRRHTTEPYLSLSTYLTHLRNDHLHHQQFHQEPVCSWKVVLVELDHPTSTRTAHVRRTKRCCFLHCPYPRTHAHTPKHTRATTHAYSHTRSHTHTRARMHARTHTHAESGPK